MGEVRVVMGCQVSSRSENINFKNSWPVLKANGMMASSILGVFKLG